VAVIEIELLMMLTLWKMFAELRRFLSAASSHKEDGESAALLGSMKVLSVLM
jgi:hypothetical protein